MGVGVEVGVGVGVGVRLIRILGGSPGFPLEPEG